MDATLGQSRQFMESNRQRHEQTCRLPVADCYVKCGVLILAGDACQQNVRITRIEHHESRTRLASTTHCQRKVDEDELTGLKN
jgi:hypothetical protein